MKVWRLGLLAACLSAIGVGADAAGPQPQLAGLGFLVGSWTGGDGKVAETGGVSKGTSVITVEAGGGALLRRDHVQLFDKAGRPAGGFDILMTIYADGGAVHADYLDGSHVIHYTSAAIVPGKSVTFATDTASHAPAFRLSYRLIGRTLAISFSMAPPGQTAFVPIADGTLVRRG
jgi:hypothetical protein